MAISLTNPIITYGGPGRVELAYQYSANNSDTGTVTFPSGNVLHVIVSDASDNVLTTHTLSAKSVGNGFTTYTLTAGSTVASGTLVAVCSAY
jgi:hypothetical protein